MVSLILFCWIGAKMSAPIWYYILIVWKFAVEIINAYKDRTTRKKVNSLWAYKNAPGK